MAPQEGLRLKKKEARNSMCKDPAVEGSMACSRGQKDARKAVRGRALGRRLGFGRYCQEYGRIEELPRKENQSLGTD